MDPPSSHHIWTILLVIDISWSTVDTYVGFIRLSVHSLLVCVRPCPMSAADWGTMVGRSLGSLRYGLIHKLCVVFVRGWSWKVYRSSVVVGINPRHRLGARWGLSRLAKWSNVHRHEYMHAARNPILFNGLSAAQTFTVYLPPWLCRHYINVSYEAMGAPRMDDVYISVDRSGPRESLTLDSIAYMTSFFCTFNTYAYNYIQHELQLTVKWNEYPRCTRASIRSLHVQLHSICIYPRCRNTHANGAEK